VKPPPVTPPGFPFLGKAGGASTTSAAMMDLVIAFIIFIFRLNSVHYPHRQRVEREPWVIVSGNCIPVGAHPGTSALIW